MKLGGLDDIVGMVKDLPEQTDRIVRHLERIEGLLEELLTVQREK